MWILIVLAFNTSAATIVTKNFYKTEIECVNIRNFLKKKLKHEKIKYIILCKDTITNEYSRM